MNLARLTVIGLLASACTGSIAVPSTTLDPLAPATHACPAEAPDLSVPEGDLRVGYPDEPAAWLPALVGDVAASDLSALWGLPLYDYDAHGQLRPRLLRQATVLGAGGGGWQVRLNLCEGAWSDGEPVVASDIVATIDALRPTIVGPAIATITAAEVDGPDVLVTFAAASGRWQHALADIGTILPGHVLARDGIEAYRDTIPVSGGSFHLAGQELGLSRLFTANGSSALGSPLSSSLEVLVVPRFELALGLLVDGQLDAALGHLALEVGPRVAELDGLEGLGARGGTLLTWQWQAGAAVTDVEQRRRLHAVLDLQPFAEALLDGQGTVTSSFVVGAPGPAQVSITNLDGFPELVVGSTRWHEAPALVARSVRDSIERRGGTVRTASDEAHVLATQALGDGHITTRRLGPWPSLAFLAGQPGEGLAALASADLASSARSQAVQQGLVAFDALGLEVPLVEVSVAHAWLTGVRGVIPSGWPGIGFASASQWTREP